ncbi:MAG: hypothetical protein ACFB11_14880 [Paracoccaceae bacterium]
MAKLADLATPLLGAGTGLWRAGLAEELGKRREQFYMPHFSAEDGLAARDGAVNLKDALGHVLAA